MDRKKCSKQLIMSKMSSGESELTVATIKFNLLCIPLSCAEVIRKITCHGRFTLTLEVWMLGINSSMQLHKKLLNNCILEIQGSGDIY